MVNIVVLGLVLEISCEFCDPSVRENMAVQSDTGTKDEIKTQFTTVEGVYRLLPLSEYSRPNRVAYNNSGGSGSIPPVRVSFVSLPDPSGSVSNSINGDRTKICFNYGRELFVYTYRGIKKVRYIHVVLSLIQ